MKNFLSSKKSRKIKKVLSNVGMAVMISGIIPASTAFAGELLISDSELETGAIVTLQQGDTKGFNLNLSASGSFTSANVTVPTVYTIDANGNVQVGEANSTVSLSKVKIRETVSATVNASQDLLPGTYKLVIQKGSSLVSIVNENKEGSKLANQTEDSLTFVVTEKPKPIDTTAPTVSFINPINGIYNSDSLPTAFSFELDEASEVFINGLSQGTLAVGSHDLDLPTPVEGTNTVSVYAKDAVGNQSEVISFTYFYDTIKPLVNAEADRDANNYGWYNQDVTVSFKATDENGSGIATIDAPKTVKEEGENQLVTGAAYDKAGNEGTGSIIINLDKTKPVLSSNLSQVPNAAAWFNKNVTVGFSAEDNLSGIQSLTEPINLTEGKDQSVSGYAVDKADNMGSVTVSGINIDTTNPVINVEDNKEYTLNQSVTWTASDALSGLATADKGSIDTSSVGSKTVTISAIDNAGNITEKTINYKVVYRFGGILQPINSDGSSTFKAGSTIPVKFKLTNSNGVYVSTANATITYAKVTNQVVGTDFEAVSTSNASTGNQFRYDFTDNQYVFNLSTKGLTVGTYQIRITLDDGTTQIVRVSLK